MNFAIWPSENATVILTNTIEFCQKILLICAKNTKKRQLASQKLFVKLIGGLFKMSSVEGKVLR